jgi:hypothetical protein
MLVLLLGAALRAEDDDEQPQTIILTAGQCHPNSTAAHRVCNTGNDDAFIEWRCGKLHGLRHFDIGTKIKVYGDDLDYWVEGSNYGGDLETCGDRNKVCVGMGRGRVTVKGDKNEVKIWADHNGGTLFVSEGSGNILDNDEPTAVNLTRGSWDAPAGG